MVTLLRISEVAERSGVPSSTLRYYERIGLVEPLGRSDNSYRVYDESTLERLAFIGRAKRLGMSLDDVATLVEAWFAGDCEPVQDRLRAFVSGRIGELRRQIADESAFERQLERMLVRLGDSVVSERCSPDCGCVTDPLDSVGPSVGSAALVCSLDENEMEPRLDEWRRVVGMARRTERSRGELHVVFDPSTEVIAEVARLCAAETACCPFFTFTLEITVSDVVLGIGGPAGAEDVIRGFFDLIESPDGGLASTGPHGAVGPIPVYAPAADRAEPNGPFDSAERVAG